MKEIGFWDYTCPRHGSVERYTESDWDILLDDMAVGGFNSLVLCPKWLTTGYRSSHGWLDQDPSCSAIALDNRPIHHALAGAQQRGIKTWLLIVATIFPTREFQLPGGIVYLSLEDARDHQPDALWFMGSDARLNGAVCNASLLPQWGFSDGRSARLRLMQMAREILSQS
jgi:hypothetical protein